VEHEQYGILVLWADCHNHHTFSQFTVSFADSTEHDTITKVKNRVCSPCEICTNHMPVFSCRPTHYQLTQYFHLSTIDSEEMGWWKYTSCSNITDDRGDCTTDSCINVNIFHPLLKTLLKHLTWHCIAGYLKHIYNWGKDLDLIEE